MVKQFDAVIFDLDGVICCTDEYHYRAWKTLADSIGVPFDRTVNNRLRGVSRMASLDIILEQSPCAFSQAEKDALAEQKNELYKKLLAEMTPEDLPAEVKETLDALREKGYSLAIGSSSKNTPFILEQIGLTGFFDAVSDGNNMLNAAPSRCLVIEDAVSGALAAHAGGMKAACVGDASRMGAGDWNLESVKELLTLL